MVQGRICNQQAVVTTTLLQHFLWEERLVGFAYFSRRADMSNVNAKIPMKALIQKAKN